MSANNTNELELIEQIHVKSHEARDKALLALCTSALGFSLSMYEKVYNGEVLWILQCTWILFTSSMLATLWSFVVAAETADKLHIYKTDYNEPQCDTCVARIINSINLWSNRIKLLNKIAILSFTIGAIGFIVFALINTWQGKNMSGTKSPRNAMDGITIPTSILPQPVQKGIPPLSAMIPVKSGGPAAPVAPSASTNNNK